MRYYSSWWDRQSSLVRWAVCIIAAFYLGAGLVVPVIWLLSK